MAPIPGYARSMTGSGDGYLLCSDGAERWGLNGAAGVLFVVNHSDEPRFFLVHRDPEVHQGDTWGVPGGAIDFGEDPLDAAWREALEEVPGLERVPHHVRGHYEDAPATDWSYTTFVVEIDEPFELLETTWETQAAGWFTRSELEQLKLHPAFGALWASGNLDPLLPQPRPTLGEPPTPGRTAAIDGVDSPGIS